MKGRVLLFGGTGFIGNKLAEKLIANKNEVLILGRFHNLDTNLSDVFMKIDFFHHESWKNSLKENDIIVFLIPCHMPARVDSNSIEQEYLNSFKMLLDLCKKVKIKKFILMSSGGAVYGDSLASFKELDIPQPKSAYGKLKLKLELIIQEFNLPVSFSLCIVRPSNVYGETQNPSISFGAVTTFFHKISHDFKIDIFGDLGICKDYLHVEDLTDALVLLCNNECSGIYNLGFGKTHTLRDIIEISENVLAKKAHYVFHPIREADIYHYSLDCSKARREFGFNPVVDLLTGIKRYSKI